MCITLCREDIWNVLDLGPRFTSDVEVQRQTLLATIRGVKSSFSLAELLGGYFGDEKDLTNEIKALQSYSSHRVTDSPIDMVLCSFMDSQTELTVPIRDGIMPKAIVYVRDVNSHTGAGDYYFAQAGGNFFDIDKWNNIAKTDEADIGSTELPRATISPDTHISFNPGRNYTTVARWCSPCQLNWDTRKQTFKDFPKQGAEVIVQLRNDVNLGRVELSPVDTYPFDRELSTRLKSTNTLQMFFQNLQKGFSFLTQSGGQYHL